MEPFSTGHDDVANMTSPHRWGISVSGRRDYTGTNTKVHMWQEANETENGRRHHDRESSDAIETLQLEMREDHERKCVIN
jgi:hypothetical protein